MILCVQTNAVNGTNTQLTDIMVNCNVLTTRLTTRLQHYMTPLPHSPRLRLGLLFECSQGRVTSQMQHSYQPGTQPATGYRKCSGIRLPRAPVAFRLLSQHCGKSHNIGRLPWVHHFRRFQNIFCLFSESHVWQTALNQLLCWATKFLCPSFKLQTLFLLNFFPKWVYFMLKTICYQNR